MMNLNRYRHKRARGFASLDALFSLLPIVLIVFIMMNASAALAKHAIDASSRQALFDRLVSAGDYTVKSGAARHEGGVRYPNWLDADAISVGYVSDLRGRAGLESLYVSFDEPAEPYGMCIYRLVVVGDGKEIRRLIVCGD
jgi:hypothetical protein